MRLREKAFAKINLGLRILGRLPDGYHRLETIYIELEWGDTLFAEPADDIHFIYHGISVPTGEENLVFRAAQLLQKEMKVHSGAGIILEKDIPVGGGLGGGSSDAAATLRLLSRLWGVNPGKDVLMAMARALGADVPFFLEGGVAYATGIGDRLQPVRWGFDGWIVLFYPEWEVSTPWAYGQWDLLGRAPAAPLPLSDHLDRMPGDPEFRRIFANDFEAIIFQKYPVLRHHYHRFWETGADYVGLSGSGSSLFGLYSDRDRAAVGLQWAQSQGWGCLARRRSGENRENREAG